MKATLVTGANGYIGRHLMLAMKDRGLAAVGIDNCVNSSAPEAFFTPLEMPFYRADAGCRKALEVVLGRHEIDSAIHFAGRIYVAESFRLPFAYYGANISDALVLFETCLGAGIRNIIFSSSAGVYGEAETLPIPEGHPTAPLNPYGRSKLAAEWILRDLCAVYPESRYGILRYFNVAGADPHRRAGQNSPTPQHLIEIACEAALGMRSSMSIYGTDYTTPDGTCIRDYIHVTDLAAAHLALLEKMRGQGGSYTLNCGYGHGFSVREIVDAVKRITGRDFPVSEAERRPGDAAALVASNERIRETLGWVPTHDSIDDIIASAFEWKELSAENEACRA